MSKLRDSETRRRFLVGVLLAVLMVGVLVGGVAAYRFVMYEFVECSPPSQGELRTQEAFIRAHLSDVREVELDALDCDDDGVGYVSFATDLTPAAARAAFLADGSCLPGTNTDPSDSGVTCGSSGVRIL